MREMVAQPWCSPEPESSFPELSLKQTLRWGWGLEIDERERCVRARVGASATENITLE